MNEYVTDIIRFGTYVGTFMYGSFWVIGLFINSGFSMFEYITKK